MELSELWKINKHFRWGEDDLTSHIVKKLEIGANIDELQNKYDEVSGSITDNYTFLMYACHYQYYHTVKVLLKYGADPNIQNRDGETALVRALSGGNTALKTFDIVRMLLKKGADPNIEMYEGDTPLLIAFYRLGYPFPFNPPRVTKLLLDSGANPNVQTRYGNTPLMLAGINKCESLIISLLEAGADPPVKNSEGKCFLDDSICKELYQQFFQNKNKRNLQGDEKEDSDAKKQKN